MGNKILVILGASSVGKDCTARILEQEHGYNFVVSTTTRPMRPGETQRDPYNFITREEFESLITNDKLIEYREYHTLVNNEPDIWYYGVEFDEVDPEKSYVCVLDTVGLKGFKEHFGDKVISFYLEADDEIRKQRCLNRGDFDEFEWNRRLEDDKIRFSKEVIEKEIDYVVESLDKQKTVKDILEILNNGK